MALDVACPLLVVDEMCAGRGTPFEGEIAERLINARADHGRAMLITTNLSADEFRDRIGPRAWSRLGVYHPTEVLGVDMREGTR